MRKDKKDEEAGLGNPYSHLDKTSVFQEARAFNKTPIVVRECNATLCKILYLLQNGETIGKTEATDTFFAITKLWQCKDSTLRRLVFLAIKELCHHSNDVIIVISSLTKDMTGNEDVYRGPAIRALCRITDSGMLQAIERYMKQAIVDKVPSVSSAALVSSVHLMKKSPEVIRRWANEVQEAVNSDNPMVQYHALGLLYQIRSNDKLAVSKLLHKFGKSGMRSPLALCYLIRIAANLIQEEEATDRTPLAFIESCLRHKSEMVTYEAASAIVRLPNITSGELAAAVNVLQMFCSSPKPSLRFAAVRTLNKISINYPQAVMSCNVDLEQLITDQNRSIATLAITTLLKTGAESSVERLMKQISSFVSEIVDEFKVVVVEAIRSLCSRYPRKHATMMVFLSAMLRDDGGLEYKKALVDTVISIIEENPETRETGLVHLCEFIEDCEHSSLASRVLHILGTEGPITSVPEKYIRFIYNRVVLEATEIRAAAVTALARFGALCPKLRPSIEVLLKRCLLDTDDEVRDRATFFLRTLQSEDAEAVNKYIISPLQVSDIGLERATETYVKNAQFDKPFDLKVVPVSAAPITLTESKPSSLSVEPVAKKEEKSKVSRQDLFAQQLFAIADFADLGPLFRSSKPIELTESVTEYAVTLIKHTFAENIVLQFDCKNTLNDQLLEKVHVELEASEEEGWVVQKVLPLAALPYGNEKGTTYILLAMPEDGGVSGTFSATLKFNVRDVDPTTGEPESDDVYDDTFALEDVSITLADHILAVQKPNYSGVWEQLGEENEYNETFALPVASLQEAVSKLQDYLGMAACEHSDKIVEGKSQHQLLLSGVFRGGLDVLARVRMVQDQVDQIVNINVIIRSEDGNLSELVGASIS
ncbi:unnamed protein product [Bursaphelenchus okinawaensis]|uniref:Coatomer subunit gamma n=1 Tax=Bursaphelenchus okinawaensis TaxID=465554 RepID=A0A811KY57_9BILA|nr:unnamed protein product [Bursaphelenchus okinawaensis]CAG9113612.1 unnamed protein product [Bursaphelenchus okinawaensis]